MSFDQVIAGARGQLQGYDLIETDWTSEYAKVTLSRAVVTCRLDLEYDEDETSTRFDFFATAKDSFSTYGKPKYLFGLPADVSVEEIATALAVAARAQMDGTRVPSPWRWNHTRETRTTWFASCLAKNLEFESASVEETSLMMTLHHRTGMRALFVRWDSDDSFWSFRLREIDQDGDLGEAFVSLALPADFDDEDVTEIAQYWAAHADRGQPDVDIDSDYPLPHIGLTDRTNLTLAPYIQALHECGMEVVRVHLAHVIESTHLQGHDIVVFRDGEGGLFFLARPSRDLARWKLFCVKHNLRVELDYDISSSAAFDWESSDLFEQIPLSIASGRDALRPYASSGPELVPTALTAITKWVEAGNRCPSYRFEASGARLMDDFDGFLRHAVSDELKRMHTR